MNNDRFNRAADSLGTPTHYNGILFGNFTALQADCEGALAVGGNATFGSPGYGYDVGAASVAAWDSVLIGRYENPDDYPTLLLGGEISSASTSAQIFAGDVVLTDSYKAAYESHAFQFGADKVRYEEDETVSHFFDTVKALTRQSGQTFLNGNNKKIQLSDLKNLRTLNHSHYAGDQLCTDKNVLVYTVDCDESASVSIGEIGLGSYMQSYDMIVINVPAKKVSFAGGSILYDDAIIDTSTPRIYPGNALIGLVDSKLVFNFPNATEVSMAYYGVIGSILAPEAAVTAVGGSLNGMLVANSLHQSQSMELHAFTISQKEEVWEFGCEPPTGSVTIQKRDEKDQGLKSAQFSLYAYDETQKKYVFLADGSTETDGALVFDELPMGLYKLVETKAPYGYVLPDKHEWQFELTTDNEGEVQELEILYIRNTLAKGRVTLYKLDYDDKSIKLENAVFSLYAYNGDTGAYDILEKTNLITDGNGVLTVSDLAPGKYKLVETAAPTGYYLSEYSTAEFEITLDRDGEIEACEDVEVLNQKLATVEIIKSDAKDSTITLEGAVFTLYLYDDGTGQYDEVSSGLSTDANGKLTLTGLKPGSYKLVETAAPQGYYLPEVAETEFPVECDSDDRIIAVELISITNKQLGKIQFYKIDSEDEKLFLEGAEFTLYKKDGEGVYQVYRTGLVSDADGSLLIEELEPGDYKLVETKAPFGYLLPADPEVEFKIEL